MFNNEQLLVSKHLNNTVASTTYDSLNVISKQKLSRAVEFDDIAKETLVH
jgi:hypothetical protein